MKFRTEDYMLPAHWASYLINGDATSFSLNDDGGDEEIAVIDQIIDNIGLSPVSCSDDPVFMKYHDARPYGVLACDCLMFTFLRQISDVL
jgi:hypothetical protein